MASQLFTLKGPPGLPGAGGPRGHTGDKGPVGLTGPRGRSITRDGVTFGMTETGNSATVGHSDQGWGAGHWHSWSRRTVFGNSVRERFPSNTYNGTFDIQATGVYLVWMNCYFNASTVGRISATNRNVQQLSLFDEQYVYSGPTVCRFMNTIRLVAGDELDFYYNIAPGKASSTLAWNRLAGGIHRLM